MLCRKAGGSWGGDIAEDPIAALRRDGLVHVLGNLTLVNRRLNPTMSNRPWTAQEAAARDLGDHGKRDYLLQHSQLKLNAQIVAEHEDAWTEDDIRARTDSLIGRVATIWPRPDIGVQQTGPVTLTTERAPDTTAEAPDETAEDASHTGKYRQLWRWLQDQGRDEISLTFADVEQVLGMPLPQSARRHPTHWYGYEGTHWAAPSVMPDRALARSTSPTRPYCSSAKRRRVQARMGVSKRALN